MPSPKVIAAPMMPRKGAAKVFAIDVGTNQLAWKLRQDPRVVVHEKTNARYLTDEQIITSTNLLALHNQNRLTFFVTGTCDMSTYDNPDLTSAGELVLTDNATGGAVAQAFYKQVPEAIVSGVEQRLRPELWLLLQEFCARYQVPA